MNPNLFLLTAVNKTSRKTNPSKKNKVLYFAGGKTEVLQYHLIRYLKKEPDNVIIRI